MNKDLVNQRNTKTWIKMNDDSKSHIWREKFISEHGGRFEKKGKYWEWQTIYNNDETINEPIETQYEFTDSSGIKYLVTNFSKFCRENELNKAAMYGVMNGTRNHHKGFVCKKLTQK